MNGRVVGSPVVAETWSLLGISTYPLRTQVWRRVVSDSDFGNFISHETILLQTMQFPCYFFLLLVCLPSCYLAAYNGAVPVASDFVGQLARGK